MNISPYVLVTPVKNEEKTIEVTIQSVINQTLLPLEWVIVSDQSTDATDDIVRRYAANYGFINFIRLQGTQERSFASVVHVTEVGVKAIKSVTYDYLGLLDADVRLSPNYYEALLDRFSLDPMLGLAGGLVRDVVNGRIIKERHYMKDVAGATQFFRRQCFESLGGLVAIPEGGWDAITCFVARANGFHTATFPELIVEHLKPRNVSQGNVISRNWQVGTREYALGNHPLFEIVKCFSRVLETPIILGVSVRFLSFTWCYITRRRRMIDPKLINMIRNEQLCRILPRFMLKNKISVEHQREYKKAL
jgi:glycosyltransferase involved in cell wall biosynthesis